MNTYEFNNKETGWVTIPRGTKTVVAHFKDGHKETMELCQFLVLGVRKKNQITRIDCYSEGEKIQEEQ